MSLGHNTSVVRDGLVFYFDSQNKKSWVGAPCTNIIPGTALGVYNNSGANITHSLTQTTDTYLGAPIWKHVITPVNATGVSNWSGNVGVGVYHGLGTVLTASTYSAHSIFFRSDSAFAASPIYTQYSNVPGWQSTNLYDVMGDGWYRGRVMHYDTTQRSDSKYWAINTATPTIGVPVTIYWAAPFRANTNIANHIPAYTGGTRSSTQALVDMVNGTTLTVNALSYAADGTFSFNGSTDYCTITAPLSGGITTPFTLSAWAKSTNVTGWQTVIGTAGTLRQIGFSGSNFYYGGNGGGGNSLLNGGAVSANTWCHMTFTFNGTTAYGYLNTVQTTGSIGSNGGTIGNNYLGNFGAGELLNGSIGQAMIYNRAITAAENTQNFNATKGRFGI